MALCYYSIIIYERSNPQSKGPDDSGSFTLLPGISVHLVPRIGAVSRDLGVGGSCGALKEQLTAEQQIDILNDHLTQVAKAGGKVITVVQLTGHVPGRTPSQGAAEQRLAVVVQKLDTPPHPNR